jgi:hypothetical protein
MADLGKESIAPKTAIYPINEQLAGSHVIVLPDQLTESVTGIIKNGNILSFTEYCYVPNKCWISFSQALVEGDTLVITYLHSPHPDIVITNWDSGKGNYIFYNTNPPVGLPEWQGKDYGIQVFPNPAGSLLNLQISGLDIDQVEIIIRDLTGRKIISTGILPSKGPHRIGISSLAAGTYVVHCGSSGALFVKKR